MDILSSIVRIKAKLSSKHGTAGTGFFAEGGWILTCAHVIDEAEKVNENQVYFFIEGQAKRYTAEIVFTSPTYDGEDFCVLKPIGLEPSLNIRWLKLVNSRRDNKYEFKTFGYPIDAGTKGIIGIGSVYGWKKDEFERDVLQLSSKEVKKGFSGGPIISVENDGVVGITRDGFDFGLDKKLGEIGFAIPSEIIRKAFPQLKIGEGYKRTTNTGWFYGHRYGDLATFTGRAAELNMLNEWLNNDKYNLLMIRALGGFGKSALAWTWFNRVRVERGAQWPTAVWWSFYEKESGFESFLSEALKHLGVEVKESARQQVNDLLEALRGTNILIVLDGFERLLRQYGRMDAALVSDDEDAEIDPSQRDCSSIAAENFLRGISGLGAKSKVLMTTRLTPRVLESADGKLLKGCRDEALSAFSPEDAVTYFHNEAIKATRAEIIAVCSAYGYHPLSLSLLVGLINEDHEQRGDIAAVKNLEIFDNVKARRHHVLERAYGSLAPERRDLLSKISCFRGSMEYAVLKKVFPSPDLDKALLDLRKRGLLQYAGETQRYDMHPIVRHYAYDHFTDEKRRKEAHVELARHFIDVMPVTNTKVKTLEDLAPVIELYHHMVGAGSLDEALKLFQDRLASQLLYQFGAYQLRIELLHALFLDGEDKPPRLKKDDDQAWTLNGIANSYALSGQLRRAVPLYLLGNEVDKKSGNKQGMAIGLGAVAKVAQLPIGMLKETEHNVRREIELGHEIENKFVEALGHQELGRVLSYRGVWQEAEQELDVSVKLFEKVQNFAGLGISWSHKALRQILMAHESMGMFEFNTIYQFIQNAVNAQNEWSKRYYPIEHENVRNCGLLGAAYRMNNELTLAEENLSKALNLCRQINLVDAEADILLDLARLRYASQKSTGTTQGDFKDAQEKASEALMITERSGYVLQGADVNLFLAQYALEQEKDKQKAKEYAETALKLATCDGPPYYYKVAYEEAERLIAKLKD